MLISHTTFSTSEPSKAGCDGAHEVPQRAHEAQQAHDAQDTQQPGDADDAYDLAAEGHVSWETWSAHGIFMNNGIYLMNLNSIFNGIIYQSILIFH